MTAPGYRFRISEAKIDKTDKEDIIISITVANDGSAPVYGSFPIHICLSPDASKAKMFDGELSSVDISQIMPGESASGIIRIPKSALSLGAQYTLEISVEDNSGKAYIPLAINCKNKDLVYSLGRFRFTE